MNLGMSGKRGGEKRGRTRSGEYSFLGILAGAGRSILDEETIQQSALTREKYNERDKSLDEMRLTGDEVMSMLGDICSTAQGSGRGSPLRSPIRSPIRSPNRSPNRSPTPAGFAIRVDMDVAVENEEQEVSYESRQLKSRPLSLDLTNMLMNNEDGEEMLSPLKSISVSLSRLESMSRERGPSEASMNEMASSPCPPCWLDDSVDLVFEDQEGGVDDEEKNLSQYAVGDYSRFQLAYALEWWRQGSTSNKTHASGEEVVAVATFEKETSTEDALNLESNLKILSLLLKRSVPSYVEKETLRCLLLWQSNTAQSMLGWAMRQVMDVHIESRALDLEEASKRDAVRSCWMAATQVELKDMMRAIYKWRYKQMRCKHDLVMSSRTVSELKRYNLAKLRLGEDLKNMHGSMEKLKKEKAKQSTMLKVAEAMLASSNDDKEEMSTRCRLLEEQLEEVLTRGVLGEEEELSIEGSHMKQLELRCQLLEKEKKHAREVYEEKRKTWVETIEESRREHENLEDQAEEMALESQKLVECVSELEGKVDELRRDKSFLQNDMSQTKAEMQKKVKLSTKEGKKWKTRNTQLQKEVDRLKLDNDSKDEEIEKLSSRLKENTAHLKQDLASLNSMILGKEAEITKAIESSEEHRKEAEIRSVELQHQKREMLRFAEESSEKENRTEIELGEARRDLDEIQTRLDSYQGNERVLEARLASYQGNERVLEARLASYQGNERVLEARLASYQGVERRHAECQFDYVRVESHSIESQCEACPVVDAESQSDIEITCDECSLLAHALEYERSLATISLGLERAQSSTKERSLDSMLVKAMSLAEDRESEITTLHREIKTLKEEMTGVERDSEGKDEQLLLLKTGVKEGQARVASLETEIIEAALASRDMLVRMTDAECGHLEAIQMLTAEADLRKDMMVEREEEYTVHTIQLEAVIQELENKFEREMSDLQVSSEAHTRKTIQEKHDMELKEVKKEHLQDMAFLKVKVGETEREAASKHLLEVKEAEESLQSLSRLLQDANAKVRRHRMQTCSLILHSKALNLI